MKNAQLKPKKEIIQFLNSLPDDSKILVVTMDKEELNILTTSVPFGRIVFSRLAKMYREHLEKRTEDFFNFLLK